MVNYQKWFTVWRELTEKITVTRLRVQLHRVERERGVRKLWLGLGSSGTDWLLGGWVKWNDATLKISWFFFQTKESVKCPTNLSSTYFPPTKSSRNQTVGECNLHNRIDFNADRILGWRGILIEKVVEDSKNRVSKKKLTFFYL